jgi:hypothetical protein
MPAVSHSYLRDSRIEAGFVPIDEFFSHLKKAA